jgi:hypothetical protein
MEIIETGELRRIGYENTEDVQIRAIFQGIYGVGVHSSCGRRLGSLSLLLLLQVKLPPINGMQLAVAALKISRLARAV